MPTMKEAHIDADTNVTLHDVPIPELMDPHQILIKVVVAGCNPKDWKMPAGMLVTIGSCPNSGDDVAGVYHLSSNPFRCRDIFLYLFADSLIVKVSSLPWAPASMTFGPVTVSLHYINSVLHTGLTLNMLSSGTTLPFILETARSKKLPRYLWHIIWHPSDYSGC